MVQARRIIIITNPRLNKVAITSSDQMQLTLKKFAYYFKFVSCNYHHPSPCVGKKF